MTRPQRKGSKLKRKPGRTTPSRVRVSARSLAEARVDEPKAPKRRGARRANEARELPLGPIPVRTAMTPRPDLTMPNISVQNVDWEDADDASLSPLIRWPHEHKKLESRLGELGIVGREGRPAEMRFDPKEGRLVWLDEAQVPQVEARAQVLGTWSRGSSTLAMAWADPLLSTCGVSRLEDVRDFQSIDEASAHEVALRASEASGAEFATTIDAPHAIHFLALRSVKPALGSAPVTPGTPVGTVLRGLADLRGSISRRDEPTDVLRARFLSLGKTLLGQAEGPYCESEWVGRLQRAGKVLTLLAARLVPPTFSAIAAGRQADEWLDQGMAVDLIDAIKLLEDEWGAFT